MRDDPDIVVDRDEAQTSDGWSLGLRRTVHRRPEPWGEAPARPVLIVPGYGMNSFIFGFHPRGRSLEGHLAWRGYEVWSVDLRAQGRSRPPRMGARREPFGLEALALIDVPAAVERVLARSRTGARHVDLVGCSLGTAIVLGYAVHHPAAPVGALVSFGGPLRWERVHPLVSVAFGSPRLAGAIPFRGTRGLVRALVPVLSRFPSLLGIYMNPASSDLSRLDEMVQTVEDPVPRINREIAEWIARRDLILRGVNLTEAVGRLPHPLLCIVARDDGIVPPETARSPYHASRAAVREVLEVGGRGAPIAHADLFLAHDAQETVFDPLARWLARQRT
jgi:pimeloyl-ACP methyl ester carboxylesterase